MAETGRFGRWGKPRRLERLSWPRLGPGGCVRVRRAEFARRLRQAGGLARSAAAAANLKPWTENPPSAIPLPTHAPQTPPRIDAYSARLRAIPRPSRRTV